MPRKQEVNQEKKNTHKVLGQLTPKTHTTPTFYPWLSYRITSPAHLEYTSTNCFQSKPESSTKLTEGKGHSFSSQAKIFRLGSVSQCVSSMFTELCSYLFLRHLELYHGAGQSEPWIYWGLFRGKCCLNFLKVFTYILLVKRPVYLYAQNSKC